MKIDKLLNSPWFVKVVALFLALMLYAAVNMDTTANPPATNFEETSKEYEALPNIPLNAYYDRDKYSISNLPQNVTVYLEGASSVITTTKVQEDFEVYVDLQNLEAGEHKVRVQSKGFSNKLDVRVEPSELTVNIRQKVSQEMAVEIDFLNKDQVVEGYTSEQPIILPNKVKVIGAKEVIEKIGFVKGFVDLKGADETVEKSIPLKVYDKNGELLNLDIVPSVVEVKVPIIAPNKTVPIIISRTGELPEGLSIESFEIIPNEVTIFGVDETIKEIEYIDNISFDLTNIKEDTTQEVELPIPEGVKRINPTTVTVKVNVEPEETKKITNVPVKVIGVSDDLKVSFISPSQGVVDLNVHGSSSVLRAISRSEFHVVLNTSEYVEGEHEINLEVFGPQDVRWEINTEKAVVEITKK